MDDHFYNKETMNALIANLHDKIDVLSEKATARDVKIDQILNQTIKTNGRVTKQERYLLIVACVVATLLFTNGSELVGFVMKLI